MGLFLYREIISKIFSFLVQDFGFLALQKHKPNHKKKKMKKHLLKFSSSLLASLLTILGFSACGDENGAEEYGVPTAKFMVTGTVTDETGNPVKGIEVTVKEKNGNSYYDITSDGKPHATTDEKGQYTTQTLSTIGLSSQSAESIAVIMNDVDGDDNGGKFKTDTLKADELSIEKVEEGSGWITGTYKVTANKQLKHE